MPRPCQSGRIAEAHGRASLQNTPLRKYVLPIPIWAFLLVDNAQG